MRRALDVASALILAVLFAPLLALIALAVMVRMGRPVLFRQARSGRGGATFNVVKFRTMCDARYPGEADSLRTPPLGLLLRACSLDELPQLWNILRGDMSLIGPRPTLPEQVERYSDRERGRLAVRPGLTGWAQINGRNAISWPERIELDLWYIAHRSPALDAKILARTARLVVRRHGVVGEGGINPGYPGTNSSRVGVAHGGRDSAAAARVPRHPNLSGDSEVLAAPDYIWVSARSNALGEQR